MSSMDVGTDDLMLNTILVGKPGNKNAVKKSDLKREKYANKIKNYKKSSHSRSDSNQQNKHGKQFSERLFQNVQTDARKKQTSMSEPKQIQADSKIDQPKSYEQPMVEGKKILRDNTLESKKKPLQVKPKIRKFDKSVKKVRLEKKQSRNGSINLKSLNQKMEDITQIMPQKSLQQMDKVPIDILELNRGLTDSLQSNGIQKLTEIQTLSYSKVFRKKDCIIKAATGSGKTLAYLIPLINQMLEDKSVTKRQDGTSILVVCPTRQLCLQAQKQAQRCLKRSHFIVTGCLVGGEQTNHEKSRIRKGIPLLFSTPGRLLYHLKNTKSFEFKNLKAVVFEEADRTLDMGFHKTVGQIIESLEQRSDFIKAQKVLVSAHFNEKVQSLIRNLQMETAEYIGFKSQQSKESALQPIGGIEMGDGQKQEMGHEYDQEINSSQNLRQQYVLISEEEKIPFMLSYISVLPSCKVMVFVSTISEVEYFEFLLNHMVYRDSNGRLTEERIEKRSVYKIHGDLDQKLRTNTYFEFRSQKSAIMISTEVASRGLDFPDLTHIILFDVPPTITDYGNRIGRSGRFNSTGVSLLLLHYQESDYAEKLRYYNKEKALENISKDLVFDRFEALLNKLNIHDRTVHYLEGIVRSLVKDSDQMYQVARKAYVSMLRAYARLTDKHIFHVKKLNLKMLSRTFGLNSAQAENSYNPKAKESHFEAIRKKRKVESVKSLQVSEYL